MAAYLAAVVAEPLLLPAFALLILADTELVVILFILDLYLDNDLLEFKAYVLIFLSDMPLKKPKKIL